MSNRLILKLCALCLLGVSTLPAAAQEDESLENTSWQLVIIHGDRKSVV